MLNVRSAQPHSTVHVPLPFYLNGANIIQLTTTHAFNIELKPARVIPKSLFQHGFNGRTQNIVTASLPQCLAIGTQSAAQLNGSPLTVVPLFPHSN